MTQTPAFLHDWSRAGLNPHAQREYVRKELQRIAGEGRRVLTEILTAPFEGQSEIALSLIAEGALGEYGQGVRLRLVEGAVPPPLDPQGRELPEADRGKVLVAKVGTAGGALNNSHALPAVVVDVHSGPNVQRASFTNQDIYRYVRLSRRPVVVPFAAAVVVLRQWGKGINSQHHYRRGEKRPDPRAPMGFEVVTVVQSTQLVEELPLVEAEAAPESPDPRPAKGRAA